MRHPVNLSSAQSFEEPFPHFFVSASIGSALALEALSWLENGAPWKLTVAEFYEQYEFSLRDIDLPASLTCLREHSELSYLSREMSRLFSTSLLEHKVDITAHKLISGQRIRIHNDYIPGQETHRLLVQLNRGWCEKSGGLLLLFDGPSPDNLSRIVRPFHQSALGFAISSRSQHAVAPVTDGERYTLVYSFYAG